MSIQERVVQPKYLSQNLSSTGTTLYLQDLVDWDNTSSSAKLLSSADFGTVVYALLRNISRTQIEIIEIDPSTITVATSPITINKRALGYNGGTTADTETAYDWLANETIVELGSDVPQLLSNYVNITDAQTIAGVKTFSSLPIATPAPTTDYQLSNKKYVDDTATFGAPSMGLTTAGIGEEATAAEIDAGTQAGGTTEELIVNPKYLKDSIYYTQLPSVDQKAALASTTTPASVNKYVSQSDFQKGADIYFVSAAGTDTYAIAASPAIAAYTQGMTFRFLADAANTGAATLNVNSKGAIAITKNGGTALADNDILANQIITVTYTTVGSTRFEITGRTMLTKAQADLLIGGADANSLHTHTGFTGVGTAVNKTYHNFNIPFLQGSLWGPISGATAIWTVANTSTSSIYQGNHMYWVPTSDTSSTIITTNALDHIDADATTLKFDSGKTIIVEFVAQFKGATGEEGAFGLTENVGSLIDYNDATYTSATFAYNTDGTLYGHTANSGGTTNHTETAITGITLTNKNLYRIEFTPTVDVKFYVNGVLKATNTTNIPAEATVVKFGWGTSGNTSDNCIQYITSPDFSIQN